MMTNNPVLNAGAAVLYIIFLVSLVFAGIGNGPDPDTILMPIFAISLFTLSAAVMGYLFCYQPLLLLLDGKKKMAVSLFLQTVAVFGGFTAVAYLLLLIGVLR